MPRRERRTYTPEFKAQAVTVSVLDEADPKLTDNEYPGARGDFAHLIEAVRDQTFYRRFAVSFAAVIAGLDDWRAKAFVELLQKNLPKPNDFDALLTAKAAELELLRRFEDAP